MPGTATRNCCSLGCSILAVGFGFPDLRILIPLKRRHLRRQTTQRTPIVLARQQHQNNVCPDDGRYWAEMMLPLRRSARAFVHSTTEQRNPSTHLPLINLDDDGLIILAPNARLPLLANTPAEERRGCTQGLRPCGEGLCHGQGWHCCAQAKGVHWKPLYSRPPSLACIWPDPAPVSWSLLQTAKASKPAAAPVTSTQAAKPYMYTYKVARVPDKTSLSILNVVQELRVRAG